MICMGRNKFQALGVRVCRLIQVQQERSLHTVNDGREAAASIAAPELRSYERQRVTRSRACWAGAGISAPRLCHCVRTSSVIRRSIDESGIRRALESYRTHIFDVPQRRLSAYLQPFRRIAKKSLNRYRHSPARAFIATASVSPIGRLVNWSIRMSRLTQCGGIGKLVAGSKPKSKALPLTRLDSMMAMQGMHSFFNAEPRFSN